MISGNIVARKTRSHTFATRFTTAIPAHYTMSDSAAETTAPGVLETIFGKPEGPDNQYTPSQLNEGVRKLLDDRENSLARLVHAEMRTRLDSARLNPDMRRAGRGIRFAVTGTPRRWSTTRVSRGLD